MFQNVFLRQPLLALLFVAGLMSLSFSAWSGKPAPVTTSPLATDLAALVTQGQAVDAEIAGINLTAAGGCTDLGAAATSLGDWLAATNSVSAGMTSVFSVDTASLTSLDSLSGLAVSIASNIKALSLDLNGIAAVEELVEYDAMLAAMLTLSTDIGSMADRIGEMADRILVMADNIGLMADRILITQQLQSDNLIAVQSAMLVTQQNAVLLSDTISTLVYNPALASLVTQGNALSTSMDLTFLTGTTMGLDLARLQGQAATYLAQVNLLYTQVMGNSAVASLYTNADTLTMAGDLSDINRALALSLDGFADRVNSLAPITSTPVLADATDSMLALSRDIGIMSDRIMEMVDRIVIMADNIGDMSVRIVDTQNLQQTNAEFTQASLLTATATTVNVISAYGL